MEKREFYEIKSNQSEVFEQGLRKVSFQTRDDLGFFLFIWFDAKNLIQKFQLIFGNRFLDWDGSVRWGTITETESAHNPSGILRVSPDRTIYKSALEILTDSTLPKEYGLKIKPIINSLTI